MSGRKEQTTSPGQFYGWTVILAGSLVGSLALPGWAEQTSIAARNSSSPPQEPINRPALTVTEWMAQIEAATVQVTAITLEPVAGGLDIALQTADDKPLLIDANQFRVEGNALIAEIPNAVLALPETPAFQAKNPTDDIATVQVVQADPSQIQIVVTGTNGLPTSEVTVIAGDLAYSLNPDGEDREEEIVVTGDRPDGYNPAHTTTATGTNTPLRDVPLSVQVVPQQVLQDRNVTELGSALETVGGVSPSGARGTSVFGPGFLIRGFDVGASVFRDGISNSSLSLLSTNDIERIEVLKGPASVLFGQGEPGGIINLVSKQPLRDPRYAFSFGVGSFSTYQGDLDVTGPLSEDNRVRYRLNISYENYGSFRNFVTGDRFVVAPVVAWDISPETSITFYGQTTRSRETIDEGIVAIGNRVANLPRDRFLGESFGQFEQTQFNLGYRFNHRFSENLTLRHALRYTQFEPQRYAPLFDSLNERTGELTRLAYFAGGTYKQFFTNAELLGTFNTGSIQHQLLFGVEYRNNLEQPSFQFSDEYPSINIFNPIYTRTPYAIAPTFFRDDQINTVGIYIQDQIDLLSNLKLLAGVRYDAVDQFRTTQNLGAARREFRLNDGQVTPRFGLVYQPIEPISLYASYTTSFRPSFGASRNSDGSVFRPETGQQFEVGIKADLAERLSVTLAAFDIRKQNVTTPDPRNPTFSLQTGEVASRGIELNLGGEVTPGWNVVAGYTYLDAFVSQDTRTTVGNRLANVPEHQFSLWTAYEVQQGSLQGLGFGLGVFYVDQRQGDLENSFLLPSYFRTDAAIFYRRDNWRAQLNLQNLFDIEYFPSASYGSRLGVNPGAPFSVVGTIGFEF